MKKRHLNAELSTFPVFVNLRDHYGQTDPAEILHRHARNVGFDKPSHLVRAWRAGFVHLSMDGFDEITALRRLAKINCLVWDVISAQDCNSSRRGTCPA